MEDYLNDKRERVRVEINVRSNYFLLARWSDFDEQSGWIVFDDWYVIDWSGLFWRK